MVLDINECIPLEESPCGENSECENLIGSYECTCDTGYTMSSQGVCTNINECLLEKSVCPDFAECTDTLGSFTCTCVEGYKKEGEICAPG